MPETEVNIYCEKDGTALLIEWLKGQSKQVRNRAIVLIELLKEKGHSLRRPHVENLGRDIYELRVIVRRVQHRILYSFVGQNIVLLTHGITKANVVDSKEIEKAIEYRDKYMENPELHTYKREIEL